MLMTPAARRRACLCIAAALVGCGCGQDAAARQYELQGQILAVRPENGEVVIKHGDIKGFMPGMTMPFKVRDRAMLAGKAPGDLVSAQLSVAPGEAWIAKLEKIGSAPLDEVVAPSPAAFVIPLQPGDALPEATLTDQDGQPLPTSQLRGHATVVTFIYTRCPLPQFCPLMDRRFAEVQQALGAAPDLRGRIRLVSVSFDPDHDTPARLKAHAARLQADPAVWSFATAPPAIIDRFAAAFGVNVIREQDRTITHNLRTAVFGQDGRAVAVYSGSDWTAAQVVDDLRRALASR
jgi:protein SCO1/2